MRLAEPKKRPKVVEDTKGKEKPKEKAVAKERAHDATLTDGFKFDKSDDVRSRTLD